MSSCTKEDFGITSITNPYTDVPVSVYGETITISFVADAAWDAEIVLQDPLRVQGLLFFFASVILAQVFLVLKKKQFEKVQLYEMNF